MGILSSAIGGASSIAGGLLTDHSNRKTAEASWNRNYAAQKEFAQNSIQWRVQDAKKAGINPYAVIGGQSPGYTPQDSSYSSAFGSAISQAGNRFADAMGQLNLANVKAEVKGKELDNAKKAIELTNESLKANLGQTQKTFLNPIVEAEGNQLFQAPNGNQRVLPRQEMSIDDIASLARGLDTMYDSAGVKGLTRANKRGHVALGLTGYQYLPDEPKTAYDKLRVKMAKTAEKYGLAAGFASAIPHSIFGLLNSFGENFMPKGNNVYGKRRRRIKLFK